jgi:glyoxylase-like metal-dependent hydrolase (beta-lactamase superfamily II)
VARLRVLFVNAYFLGPAGAPDRGWVLVDAGLRGFAEQFLEAAHRRYGAARPAAIVLTHGHFDHVGVVGELAEYWDAPVYAHRLELPYLTGEASYPPGDPTVGGGAMAWSAPLFPRGPIDLDGRVRELPANGEVPGAPGWRWIHTPGHSPGHVSFFRDEDRTLIAGDAFVTVKQESLLAVLTQTPRVHGPPAYFTIDWQAAWRSVRRLAELEPELAATGHGVPLRGATLRRQLHDLADHFERRARPTRGRYVARPARADERGPRDVPPPNYVPSPGTLALLASAALAGVAVAGRVARRRFTPAKPQSP